MSNSARPAGAPPPAAENAASARCDSLLELVRDIRALVTYLGQVADRSLQQYFGKDGRPGLPQPHPVPPCDDYDTFLRTLFRLERAIALAPASDCGAWPSDEDLSFLYRSRDFLSLVASPATADTIRITRAYVEMRMKGETWREWWTRRRTRAPVSRRAIPRGEEEVQAFARLLCQKVASIENYTVFGAIFVVMLSTYALSGRLILSQQADTAQAAQVQDAELERAPLSLQMALLSGMYDDHQDDAGMPCDMRPNENRRLASNAAGVPAIASDASAGPDPSLLKMAHLCEQAQYARTRRFTALLHLRSWASVVTDDIPFVPRLFGVERSMLTSFVDRLNTQGCQFIAPFLGRMIDFDPKTDESDPSRRCGKIVVSFVTGSELVARSILDSLTLYVLPVFYAFLGSLAASHRVVRRKIDASTLGYTDRGLLQQNRVLGVLTGSVIGLLASYLGKPDEGTSLGLSALALLAGYNIGAVFSFLDSVSARVFGPTKTA